MSISPIYGSSPVGTSEVWIELDEMNGKAAESVEGQLPSRFEDGREWNDSESSRGSLSDSIIRDLFGDSEIGGDAFIVIGKSIFYAHQPALSRQEFYDYSNSGLQHIILSLEQERNLGASIDQGGHGGTLKGPLVINGETQQVFLKPFDGVEAKNYELLQKKTSQVSDFMPKVHGVTTDSRGRKFLVMENARIDTQGQELKQYGDIKIAGKVSGFNIDNLICDQGEMIETRGKKKGRFDYYQMKSGADKAPGFMFYKDGAFLGKAGRILEFKNSTENLQKKLREANPTKEDLMRLGNEILLLRDALKESGVALIGGSVIIVEDEQGGLKPKLIDPAHVQYDPSKKEVFGEQEGLYYGDKAMFKARQESNQVGLLALHKAIVSLALRDDTPSREE